MCSEKSRVGEQSKELDALTKLLNERNKELCEKTRCFNEKNKELCQKSQIAEDACRKLEALNKKLCHCEEESRQLVSIHNRAPERLG